MTICRHYPSLKTLYVLLQIVLASVFCYSNLGCGDLQDLATSCWQYVASGLGVCFLFLALGLFCEDPGRSLLISHVCATWKCKGVNTTWIKYLNNTSVGCHELVDAYFPLSSPGWMVLEHIRPAGHPVPQDRVICHLLYGSSAPRNQLSLPPGFTVLSLTPSSGSNPQFVSVSGFAFWEMQVKTKLIKNLKVKAKKKENELYNPCFKTISNGR